MKGLQGAPGMQGILCSQAVHMSVKRGAQSRQFKASDVTAQAYSGRVKKYALRRMLMLLLHLCAIFFALVWMPSLMQSASAQTVKGPGPDAMNQALHQALPQAISLARQAASVQAPAQARVHVEPGQLDSRLTLAPCARVEAFLWPGVPAWGATRVGLRCLDGATRWRVSLPMHVQVWAPGVVLRTELPAGVRLLPEHLRLAEVDWAAGNGAAFAQAELVQGRTLARPAAVGQALRSGDLQTRQWFARGETVQVKVSGPGFAIAAVGEALNPGLEGQLVRVRMAAGGAQEGGADAANGTGRVVVGKPVGERRVEIEL
jgi:flagellar basal body P-ring formation protein FlgA